MSEALPAGTVTFLFSDIEGSTRLMRELGDGWGAVLADHRRLLRDAFAARGGREVDVQGDAFFFAFPRARDAVEAAVGAQRALAAHEWPTGAAVRVRMGIHTGEPTVGDEGYLGLDVVRGARLCSAARGGQVLLSATTRTLLGPDAPAGVELRDLGEHTLKDLDHPEHVFQVVSADLRADFGPLRRPERTDAVPFAGREQELAEEALVAADELGAVIDTHVRQRIEETQAEVRERLRERGIVVPEAPPLPPQPPPPRRATPSRQRDSRAITGGLLLTAFLVAVVVSAAVAVLYLFFG